MIQKTALWKAGIWVVLALGIDASWPCSDERLIRTSVSFHSREEVTGNLLTYKEEEPVLVQHPCKSDYLTAASPALYLGEKIFLSLDGFESSLQPLTISNALVPSPAVVSSAVFVQDTRLLIVINGEVYLYFYKHWKNWKKSEGINAHVTLVATTDCCYSTKDKICHNIRNEILVYEPGHSTEDSNIFYSVDGGYTFRYLFLLQKSHSILISLYNFVSLSLWGYLYNDTDASEESAFFMFSGAKYTAARKSELFYLKVHKNEPIMSIIPPGLRGYLIIWTKDTFIFSVNNGLTTEPIVIHPTNDYANVTVPLHDDGLCQVAVSKSEIAALSKNQKLFYGTLDLVTLDLVLIGNKNSSKSMEPCEVLMFDDTGMLSILSPVPSNITGYYNFHKCTINIQATLMTVRPYLQPCPVQIFRGDFHNKMYYIDMKQKLYFNVTFVPKPGTGVFPYVTVSNPHVLGFQAQVEQDGYTYDGNTKYRLQIELMQQQFSGMATPDFQDSLIEGRLSTVTVDIYSKGPFCIDMHPLTALIATSCPPTKHLRPFRNVTACSKGLLNELTLENYNYTIRQDVYDPQFLARKHLKQDDLYVTYDYFNFGCPILLYFDVPWLPILELWDDDKFVEYVSVDFVLYEINGMHTYNYLQTASQADCVSQPQNWSVMIMGPDGPDPGKAWSRINYHNCKETDKNKPLVTPSAEYQVLNINEKNRIVFSQYNGMYVFKVIVVDSLYSYCDLVTFVSVYVHGALPKGEINTAAALIGFLVLILGTILMGYFFPKYLRQNMIKLL